MRGSPPLAAPRVASSSRALLSFVALLVATAAFALVFFPLPIGSGWTPDINATTTTNSNNADDDDDAAATTSPQRVVLVLVDALRASFVTDQPTWMPFLRHSLRHGSALGWIAHAPAPTVTLPRIKALMTGAPPVFADALLNLGSRAAAVPHDSLPRLARQHGCAAVFFGDDTWLRLWPLDEHYWAPRSEGVTSFFVADTREVDDNVTRHVWPELDGVRGHWRWLVLHYLGLDHAGHLVGPAHPLVATKAREMDALLAAVVARLDRRSVLVVASDHGMTDGGNHGGASADETHALLVVMRGQAGDGVPAVAEPDVGAPAAASGLSSWPVDERPLPLPPCDQVDVVPTLAALLHLPVPVHNQGVLLDAAAAAMLSPAARLAAWRRNVDQLAQMAGVALHSSNADASDNGAGAAAAEWRTLYRRAVALSGELASTAAVNEACGEFQRLAHLLSTAVRAQASGTGDNEAMLARQALPLVFALVAAVAVVRHVTACALARRGVMLLGAVAVAAMLWEVASRGSLGTPLWLCAISLLLVAMAEIGTAGALSSPLFTDGGGVWLMWYGGVALHAISLASSSFVEEEHLTWFAWMGVALVCVAHDTWRRQRAQVSPGIGRWWWWWSMIGSLVAVRVLRAWHVGGDKFVHASDLFKRLAAADADTLRLASCWLCPLLVLAVVVRTAHTQAVVLVPVAASSALVALYHAAQETNVVGAAALRQVARTSFMVMALAWLWSAARWFRGAHRARAAAAWHMWALCALGALLLHRAANGPAVVVLAVGLVVPALVAALFSPPLPPPLLSPWSGAVLLTWWVRFGFFALGGSNSIATVDLNGAYTGLATFCAPAVATMGALIAFSAHWCAFGAAVVWSTVAATATGDDVAPACRWLSAVVALLVVGRAVSMLMVAVVLMVQQHHLFVWTVFAPKFVVESASAAADVVLAFVLMVVAVLLKMSGARRRGKCAEE